VQAARTCRSDRETEAAIIASAKRVPQTPTAPASYPRKLWIDHRKNWANQQNTLYYQHPENKDQKTPTAQKTTQAYPRKMWTSRRISRATPDLIVIYQALKNKGQKIDSF